MNVSSFGQKSASWIACREHLWRARFVSVKVYVIFTSPSECRANEGVKWTRMTLRRLGREERAKRNTLAKCGCISLGSNHTARRTRLVGNATPKRG